MIVSRNEIESLALKAARGAGMSWGLAEEASVAAGWLAAHALPWAGTLADLLSSARTTSPPLITGDVIAPARPGTRLCPIMTGALLSDDGPRASSLEIRDLLAPVWLAPFLASWADADRAACLHWGGVRLLVAQGVVAGTNNIPADTLAAAFAERITVALQPNDRSGRSPPRRERSGYVAPDDAWLALQAFEHKTFVPASAQSRLSGAGAGLLDND